MSSAAIVLDVGIGTGVATWTTDRIALFLDSA